MLGGKQLKSNGGGADDWKRHHQDVVCGEGCSTHVDVKEIGAGHEWSWAFHGLVVWVFECWFPTDQVRPGKCWSSTERTLAHLHSLSVRETCLLAEPQMHCRVGMWCHLPWEHPWSKQPTCGTASSGELAGTYGVSIQARFAVEEPALSADKEQVWCMEDITGFCAVCTQRMQKVTENM
jgi:hypothetical protein